MTAAANIWARIQDTVFPELARVPWRERSRAMEKAVAEPFDAIETAGLLVAVVITAIATRYGVDASLAMRISAALANFIVALPSLAMLAGPFLIRRRRRGLRKYLAVCGR